MAAVNPPLSGSDDPYHFPCNPTDLFPSTGRGKAFNPVETSLQLVPLAFCDETGAIARRKRRMARQRRSISTITSFPLLSPKPYTRRPSLHALPEMQEIGLRFLLQKELRNSDVSSLGRIVIPKRDAEENLPILGSKEGMLLSMLELGTGRLWTFKYRFWPNNKSRMYILEQTGEFVRAYHLRSGDFILIFKNDQTNNYVIHSRKSMAMRHIAQSMQVTIGVGPQVGHTRSEKEFAAPYKKNLNVKSFSEEVAYTSTIIEFSEEGDSSSLETLDKSATGNDFVSQTTTCPVNNCNSMEHDLIAESGSPICSLTTAYAKGIFPKKLCMKASSQAEAGYASSQWDSMNSTLTKAIHSDSSSTSHNVTPVSASMDHTTAESIMPNGMTSNPFSVAHLFDSDSITALPFPTRLPLIPSSSAIDAGRPSDGAVNNDNVASAKSLCMIACTSQNVADSSSSTAPKECTPFVSESPSLDSAGSGIVCDGNHVVGNFLWETEVSSSKCMQRMQSMRDMDTGSNLVDYNCCPDFTVGMWCNFHAFSPWLQTAPAIAYDLLSLDDF